ncbi:MAG: DUF4062 domain-containing protein, partial [Gemmatimonadales bacterium]
MKPEVLSPPPRVMRVFLSSTFRDMQAEREELVKRALPRIRHLCEKRGVVWSEVDLRWGVTDEQKAEGRVLPICLAEIHRCRPYFIGLLGECYGWIPDQVDPSLLEREIWLANQGGRSVTELEILHGVLNNPEMAEHAFFYFRSPAYLDQLPEEQRDLFRGMPSPEEIRRLGPREAARRAEEGRQKLARLKQRIRESRFPVVDYPDPKTLGEQIVRDLTAVLDRLFPEGSRLDPLDAEAADHEAFGQSRARVYIHRQRYFDALDRHAEGTGPPLVVLGESGSGKSALLANWFFRYRSANPQAFALIHFLGASPSSADWTAMLRRILGELVRRMGIEQPVPKGREGLREAFLNGLHLAAAKGPVVLALDGLDQLEDRDAAELVWLPREIAPNVRLVVSTLPGRAFEVLTERGWPTLTIEPLEAPERRRLIVEYLAQYAKTLVPAQVERIAATPQAANPLFLRALLEELRVWGDHQGLDRRIAHYLEADSLPALYQRILERYEQDYEAEQPGVVGASMALLWASRRGLAESELLDLLGPPDEPLASAVWSPLALAAESSLVSRSGLLGFFHDYLRQAVRDRYLPTEDEQRHAHLRIARYLAAGEIGPRMIEELPWQLSRAGEWQLLATLLAMQPQFFSAAWHQNSFEVAERWAEVEASSGVRMVDAYAPVVRSPGDDPEYAWSVGSLLSDSGHPEQAFLIWAGLADHCRETGDLGRLPQCLHGQATLLMGRGELNEAFRLFQEAERICRARGNRAGLQRILGSKALILMMRGDRRDALKLVEEKYRVCRELGDSEGTQEALEVRASILREEGNLDQALEVLEEGERRYRETGNKRGLQAILGAKAGVLQDRGDLDGAMRLNREKERICRELGNRDGLQTSLSNQATICYARGEFSEALGLLAESEQIARTLGNRDMLPGLLGMRAVIYQQLDQLDEAMLLLEEQERLCREMGMPQGVAASLGSQAEIRVSRGEFDEALRLLGEIEQIGAQLGDREMKEQASRNREVVVQLRGASQEGVMTADSFDSDYNYLAPGARELIRKAVQSGDDSVIDRSG